MSCQKYQEKSDSKGEAGYHNNDVLNMVRETVSNDPTKELINFTREEMDKSRQHELQLFQMLQAHKANVGGEPYYQHATYPAMPNYMEAKSMAPGYYPAWQGGLGQSQTTQSVLPGGSYGVPSPSSGVLSNDQRLTKL